MMRSSSVKIRICKRKKDVAGNRTNSEDQCKNEGGKGKINSKEGKEGKVSKV